MFSTLRFFFRTQVVCQNLVFIVSNSAHVIYLLTTITGSNKMNKMALMTILVPRARRFWSVTN